MSTLTRSNLFILCLVVVTLCASAQSRTSERIIQNPGYVELAPCPCDVTEKLCDLDCCCDDECTDLDKARFLSCISGLPGGQGGDTEDYKCGTSAFNPPDWHKFTCVYWENNAYLGMFYMNKAKLTTEISFTSATASYQKDIFSIRENERRYVDKDFAAVAYKKGIILTTRQPNIANTKSYSSGLLSLPQRVNSGQCNTFAPVRFLESFESSCQSSLTTTSCAALTIFSADIYLVSSAINTGTRPFQVTSVLKGQDIALSEVRYYCTTDYSSYLPSTTTSLENSPSTGTASFPATTQNIDCDMPCSDSACWQYNSGRQYTPLHERPLPNRCPSDNGVTLQDSPIMDGNTCRNVVLEVRYNFEWSGPTITRLTADVVLGNVTGVTNSPTVLAQRFSVQWTHSTNATASTVNDNFFNVTQPYQRSGIAGYDPHFPLWSGCRQTDPVTSAFQSVDTRQEMQLAVFKPGVDGLCSTATREPVAFGVDLMSSCALRLTLNDLTSCNDLRKLVGNHLNILMPSDVVGRYGYNDPNSDAMWTSVVRQNLTEIFQSIDAAAASAPALVGNETYFRLSDYISGVCLLPTSVNLNILYAKTGAINFYPRYEVIGAYINFTLSNWTMDCTGSNSQRCLSTSGQSQNFFLHSTVQFVQVPPVPPTPKSRFYTKHNPETCDSDTCYRFFTDWDTDLCYYDTCWQELAYPLTSVYQGESRQYALGVFLVLVLGIVGYASVTKPGWS